MAVRCLQHEAVLENVDVLENKVFFRTGCRRFFFIKIMVKHKLIENFTLQSGFSSSRGMQNAATIYYQI